MNSGTFDQRLDGTWNGPSSHQSPSGATAPVTSPTNSARARLLASRFALVVSSDANSWTTKAARSSPSAAARVPATPENSW